jgi:hypothetical protein
LLTEGALSPFDSYIPKEFMTYEYGKQKKPEGLMGILRLSCSTYENTAVNPIENKTKRD